MKQHRAISAIILAGGLAKRMKTKEDKSLLPIDQVPMIAKIAQTLAPYFSDIIISANSAAAATQRFAFLPYPVIADEQPGCGPLMGILSGLRSSKHQVNFIIACDIPEIDLEFLEKLIALVPGNDIVVPVSGQGKYEPLFAIYRKRLVPIIENLISRGTRKIIELYPLCRTRTIPLENDGWYRNLNTVEDYQDYLDSRKE